MNSLLDAVMGLSWSLVHKRSFFYQESIIVKHAILIQQKTSEGGRN